MKESSEKILDAAILTLLMAFVIFGLIVILAFIFKAMMSIYFL